MNPASLTVTADSKSMTYGGTVPALTYTYSGLVNNDTSAGFSGGLTTNATSSSNVGGYAITQGDLAATGNYTIGTFNTAILTVTPASLTVTADSKSMTYGGTVPALTYTYSGLVNGDTTPTFSGALTTSATSSSNVGDYGITQGNLAATGNYTIGTFNAGTLNIGKLTLVLTPNEQDVGHDPVHGDAIPTYFGYGIAGFVNGDTYNSAVTVSGTVLSTSVTSSSPAGQYPFSLNAGSLTATNYAFVLASPTATDQLIVHPTVTDVRVLWGTQSMSILGLTRDLPFSTITGIEVIYSDNVQLPLASARPLNLTAVSGTAAPPEPSSVGVREQERFQRAHLDVTLSAGRGHVDGHAQ